MFCPVQRTKFHGQAWPFPVSSGLAALPWPSVRWALDTVMLYHGTTDANAARLLRDGWHPRSGCAGSQCGDPRFLYLTNIPENALWYATEKGGDALLAVEVPLAWLIVDPHDGVADDVRAELSLPHGLPGNVCLTRALKASAFRPMEPSPRSVSAR